MFKQISSSIGSILPACAALMGVFVFIPVHVIGLIALLGASTWDIILLRKHPSLCGTTTQ